MSDLQRFSSVELVIVAAGWIVGPESLIPREKFVRRLAGLDSPDGLRKAIVEADAMRPTAPNPALVDVCIQLLSEAVALHDTARRVYAERRDASASN